jgi:hypothetical protein
VGERLVRPASGPIGHVMPLVELIRFLDAAIARAHKQGDVAKTDDLLERRYSAAELHTFLEIVEPYLKGRPTDGL